MRYLGYGNRDPAFLFFLHHALRPAASDCESEPKRGLLLFFPRFLIRFGPVNAPQVSHAQACRLDAAPCGPARAGAQREKVNCDGAPGA